MTAIGRDYSKLIQFLSLSVHMGAHFVSQGHLIVVMIESSIYSIIVCASKLAGKRDQANAVGISIMKQFVPIFFHLAVEKRARLEAFLALLPVFLAAISMYFPEEDLYKVVNAENRRLSISRPGGMIGSVLNDEDDWGSISNPNGALFDMKQSLTDGFHAHMENFNKTMESLFERLDHSSRPRSPPRVNRPSPIREPPERIENQVPLARNLSLGHNGRAEAMRNYYNGRVNSRNGGQQIHQLQDLGIEEQPIPSVEELLETTDTPRKLGGIEGSQFDFSDFDEALKEIQFGSMSPIALSCNMIHMLPKLFKAKDTLGALSKECAE
ncbi:hypothetical protein HHK36_008712 [Tetracentron sinense]|uniref:Uncharacterized protein n=1 Tax=Tetracentron sinense TaxID=13715 RepID=A0A835DNG5_TETSI|nr:hypothetical protein HHK36_008712 [Tetracentron sinense]